MTASSTPAVASRTGSVRPTLLTAWLTAGTADIVVAFVYYGITEHVTPAAILHQIASGLLGRASFGGGLATAALGLCCHFSIALIWTLFFFLIYPRVRMLARSVPITAALYGTLVSCVMSFVVLPLSRVASRPFDFSFFAVATVILWFTIGLPLSIFARRWYGRPSP